LILGPLIGHFINGNDNHRRGVHAHTAVMIGVLTTALAAMAGAVRAQDRGEAHAAPPSPLNAPFKNAAMFSSALAATAQGSTAQGPDTDHNFGVGLRAGGSNFGGGVSARYFLDGPWGVQVDLTHYSIDYPFTNEGFGSTQFAPAVRYRLSSHRFAAPLRLQPYVGAGLSFLHDSFDDGFGFTDSDNSVGAVITGGVELFFDKVPRLGVAARSNS
jgi:outer membrane protein W